MYLIKGKHVKKIFHISIIILTILLLFSVLLYLLEFHNGLSSQSSEWANFGSYLNFLNPIFTAIYAIILISTVNYQLEELRKQREAAFQPDISIAGITFKTIFKDKNDNNPKTVIKRNIYYKNELTSNESNLFIKFFNLGAAPAKNITFRWKNNIFDTKKIISTIIEKEIIKEYENNVIEIIGKNCNKKYDVKNNYQQLKYDFILQSKDNEDSAVISVPELQYFLYIEYLRLLIENNKFNDKLILPKINMKLEVKYYDINDKEYINFFDIALIPIWREYKDNKIIILSELEVKKNITTTWS